MFSGGRERARPDKLQMGVKALCVQVDIGAREDV